MNSDVRARPHGHVGGLELGALRGDSHCGHSARKDRMRRVREAGGGICLVQKPLSCSWPWARRKGGTALVIIYVARPKP